MALSALWALPSCDHSQKVNKPEVLLTEEQMIDVLFDAYLIEAELNQKRTLGENVTPLQQVYYDQLFEHYGITDTLFQQNLLYYTYQLQTLERIMDSVTNRFVKAQ